MSNVYPTFAIPVTWSEQNTYDGFKIVLYNGGAYTSKRSVPSGVQITNTDYWLPTGNVYKLMNDNITTLQTEITNINNTLSMKLDNTVMFPTTSVSDCNLAKTNGIHYYKANSLNAPTTNGGIIFACMQQPAQNQGFQIAFPNNQSFVAIRVLSSSSFGAWKAISTQNI